MLSMLVRCAQSLLDPIRNEHGILRNDEEPAIIAIEKLSLELFH